MAEQHKSDRSLWRSPYSDIFQFILLLIILGYLFSRGLENLGYNWQWYQVPPFILEITAEGLKTGPLLFGLGVTLKISAISLLLAFLIGLLTAVLRLSDLVMGRIIARSYLELVRNTPLLIQIFLIYFVLGPVLGLDRFPAAVLALSLFEGAYASEIFRSGILAVERGQIEAAASLGLNRYQIFRLIVLPQAIRTILPPLTSQAISLIKDSALVSTIAIYDLTMQAQALISETFLTFEIWFTVAILYLVITITLSFFVAFLENRLKRY
ncbi:MAG: amino acid ABC transporter permease [Desulfofustis sp.]|nr:amino acid ABC transporter permease [Desulfofustis sp.]MBT8354366.1 amino acid ABC transporter permease [Desulfofustis sp.]NNK57353.1 amino acid ABC transporter permease [Desulfofustis sp.]